MARQVNQVLWDQWRQRTERQGTSGLSIVAFCRREGVSPAAFHAWKRKLRSSASAHQPARQQACSRRRPVAGSLRQRSQQLPARSPVPTYAEDFLQLPVRGVRSSPWIELSLVDGTLVRIPQENLAALTTLLRALRGDDSDGVGSEARRA
jgi:transposase-like protein